MMSMTNLHTPSPAPPLNGEGITRTTVRSFPPLSKGRARVGVQYLPTINALKIFMGLSLYAFMANALTPAHAAPDDDFGRLFSRQNERKNLDVLRQNQKLKVITPQDNAQPEPTAEAAPIELPAPVTLQGFVKRSDGKSTLWVNNKAVQEDSSVDNVHIGKLGKRAEKNKIGADSVNVKIPANGKQIRLKAGQRYEPETNEIRELQVVEKAKRLNLEETGVISNDEKSLP